MPGQEHTALQDELRTLVEATHRDDPTLRTLERDAIRVKDAWG